MAIDYQRILMDMNRPHRRQGKSMKTILGALVLMAAIFGGTFAAWKYGLVDRVVGEARGLAGRVLDRDGGESAPTISATLTREEPLRPPASAQPSQDQQLALRPPQSLRPAQEAAVVQSVSPQAMVPEGGRDFRTDSSQPLSMESIASAAPASPVQELQPLESPRPVRGVSPAQAQAQLQAQAMQQAQSRQQREAEQQRMHQALAQEQRSPERSAGPNMNPIPVLSDAKAQLRVIDQMLNNDPAGAMQRLSDMTQMRLDPAEAAEVGYRLGYAARVLRDESMAEKSWKETVEKYPDTRGGRFSALALADTWFQHYAAGTRQQVSYWDDIQLMYSRVIGVDDAPFLPEAKKAEVKTRLNRLNDSLFFGSAPSKMARYHKVEQGELLGSIAQKYRVDYESIARINGINPNRIRAGMDLKLIVGEVDVVVRKNANDPSKQPTLTWFLDGRWVREYPSCVGDGNKTPSGTYTFTSKERDPSWTNPVNGQLLANDHPENILGSRWMAMKGMNTQGLGIHGTTVDDSIPGYTSAGCVRLLNKDVEELFSFGRIGGRVTVLD